MASAPSRQQRGRGRGGRTPTGRTSGSAQVFNVEDLDEGIFLLDEAYHRDDALGYASGEGDYDETHDVAMLAVVAELPSSGPVRGAIAPHDVGSAVPLPQPAPGSPPDLLESGPPPLTDSDTDSDSEDPALPRQGAQPLEVLSSTSQDIPDVPLAHLQYPEDFSASRRRRQLALEAEAMLY